MYFLTSDKVKIRYSTSGNGQPIIFLHGWNMSGEVFHYQRDDLCSEYRIVTVDLRGHGGSDKHESMDCSYERMGQDILELISFLELTRPVIAGWSMGVSIILASLEILQPVSAGFIFLGGTPKFIGDKTFKQAMRPIIARRLADNLEKDYSETIQNFFELLYHSEKVEDEKKVYIHRLMEKVIQDNSGKVVRNTLEQLYDGDYREELSRIRVPVLLVSGTIDKICLPGASEYMAGKISFSELEFVEDSGHMVFLTRHKICNDYIRSFVNDLS